VSDQKPREDFTSVRVTAKVHRRLLTIQYARKMAGVSVSLTDIIDQALDGQEARTS
jgi:hypothetical protein